MEEQNIALAIEMLNKWTPLVKEADDRARIHGDAYNIFHILNVHHAEAIHTYVIHDLLNPEGSHGQGTLFLEKFIDKFLPEGNFLLRGVTSTREKYIGILDNDNTKGGRIDIEIRNNSKQAVFIENKIHARDQIKQLQRYYNYGEEEEFKFFKLFYLTLDRKPPVDESGCELKEGEHFHCISYERDILNWLQECRKLSENKPLLKATLTQYINTIKILTGQSMSEEMDTIKQEIIKNIDSYNAAKAISGALSDINIELKRKLDTIYPICKSYLALFYDRVLKNKIANSSIIINEYGAESYDIKIDLVKIKAIIEFGVADIEFYYGVSVEIYQGLDNSTIEGKLKQQLLPPGKDDKRFSYDTKVAEMAESLNRFIERVVEILIETDVNKIGEN